jgi:hypothetical protein
VDVDVLHTERGVVHASVIVSVFEVAIFAVQWELDLICGLVAKAAGRPAFRVSLHRAFASGKRFLFVFSHNVLVSPIASLLPIFVLVIVQRFQQWFCQWVLTPGTHRLSLLFRTLWWHYRNRFQFIGRLLLPPEKIDIDKPNDPIFSALSPASLFDETQIQFIGFQEIVDSTQRNYNVSPKSLAIWNPDHSRHNRKVNFQENIHFNNSDRISKGKH